MTINIFLQLVSIVARGAFICLLVMELSKTKYSLWEIYINRVRYLFQLLKIWIWFNLPVEFKHPKLNEDYNKPFSWFQDNSEYKWIYIFQIALEFALFEQFGLNQIEKKSTWFFISSPMLSLSYAFVFYYFVLKNKKLQQRLQKYETEEETAKGLHSETHVGI